MEFLRAGNSLNATFSQTIYLSFRSKLPLSRQKSSCSNTRFNPKERRFQAGANIWSGLPHGIGDVLSNGEKTRWQAHLIMMTGAVTIPKAIKV